MNDENSTDIGQVDNLKEIGNSQICMGCLKKLRNRPHEDLSSRSESYIDSLPYGVIILDGINNVIKYNLTESEMTGLSPEEVEGKNFFEDIAPCTNVKAFRGILDEMRVLNHPSQEYFDFTFNHHNFFAEVEILMTYDPVTKNTVISVEIVQEEEHEGEPLIEK